MRVFVTVGSQKFPFDRLVFELDSDRYRIYEIFAQIGCSTYIPNNYESVDYLTRERFIEEMKKADVVVTHAGTGAIITALKLGKKIIAVPRLKQYSEHVDDHQIELCEVFERKQYIKTVLRIADLSECLANIDTFEPKRFVSNTDVFIRGLEAIIDE